jgi:mycothiol system anti-sigma-R factor
MSCDELDGFLYAYLDGEFEPLDKMEFERHLGACPRCAQKVHQESAFREALHSQGRELQRQPSERAPDALRRRIQAQLRHEQQRSALKSWVRAGAAAAAIAAAGGAYIYERPGSRGVFVEAAVLRHAKALPFEVQRDAPERVEAWFEGKLDHSVRVPTFPNAKLAGARLSNVKDKQAAYIAYEAVGRGASEPRRVGLFVFQDADGQVGAQPLPSIEVDSSHGYNVAIWREHEIVYELVSDLDESDIRQMLTAHNPFRRRAVVEQRPAGPPTSPPPMSQNPALFQPASVQQQPAR